MKKIITFVMIGALSASLFESCKKGEDDPAISLRTRKARMTGEWTVSEYESSGSSSNTDINNGTTNTSSNSSTITYDGQNYSDIGSSSYDGQTNPYERKGTGTFKYTFEKDGTYTEEQDFDFTEESTEQGSLGSTKTTTTTSFTSIVTGTWNFLHGVGEDVKDKEMVSLSPKSSEENSTEIISSVFTPTGGTAQTATITTTAYTDKSTYDDIASVSILRLRQLKNKEMIVESTSKYSSSSNSTSNYGGPTSTGSSISNGEFESTMTLTK